MTTILLDTNAYLRLAKRIRPLLGFNFNPAKAYTLIVLPEVENEVRGNQHLASRYPWFDEDDHRSERRSHQVRLLPKEKQQVAQDAAFLLSYAGRNARDLIQGGRSPPGRTDCYVLAVAMVRNWSVATDDEGMHDVGRVFDVQTHFCCDVLHKLMSARIVDKDKVREIYAALERNDDLTARWIAAKASMFSSVFGKGWDQG